MKAKVTKEFRGAKDGEHHPTLFKVGDTVEGKLAEVAVEQKWAVLPRAKSSAATEQNPVEPAPPVEGATDPAREAQPDVTEQSSVVA